MTFLIDVTTTTFIEVEADDMEEAHTKALAKANKDYPGLDWTLDESVVNW